MRMDTSKSTSASISPTLITLLCVPQPTSVPSTGKFYCVAFDHYWRKSNPTAAPSIDLLINAWKIDYDVYRIISPLLRPRSTWHNVANQIESSSLLVPSMIKLLWYHIMPVFRFVPLSVMRIWGGKKNKRKINNIWANTNTVWTWAARCVLMMYMASNMAHVSVGEDVLKWATRALMIESALVWILCASC